MRVEAKLEELGLTLPEAPKLPPGVELSFAWVWVYQDRAYVAGHAAQNPDGSIAEPLGKVGVDLTPEQGYEAARLSALSVLTAVFISTEPRAGSRNDRTIQRRQQG